MPAVGPRLVHHLRVSTVTAVACLLSLTLAQVGCDEQRDYRVLAFFFDGVPVPGQDQPTEPGEPGQGVDATGRPVAVQYVYHEPYFKRQCFGCHDNQTGYDLTTYDASLCGRCHESHVKPKGDDWVHGVVVFGDCARCHEAHRAELPGLLKRPEPEACFDCHESDYFKNDTFHSQLPELVCSRCHDPHNAGNRLLLVDSTSYTRRDFDTMASEHKGWVRDDCTKCHSRERSNEVTADVDKVCLSCHGDAMDPPASGAPLHQAVLDGKCTACHTPHRSPLPHLIAPRAEQNCVGCHDPTKLDRLTHPVIVRGDCLLCHGGHSTDRPKLLKPGITGPQRNFVGTDDNLDRPVAARTGTPWLRRDVDPAIPANRSGGETGATR